MYASVQHVYREGMDGNLVSCNKHSIVCAMYNVHIYKALFVGTICFIIGTIGARVGHFPVTTSAPSCQAGGLNSY